MQWIKANIMLVTVAAVSVISLVALALGFFLSSTTEHLQADSQLLSNLSMVKPVNTSVIEQARKQQQEEERQFEEFLRRHRDAGRREPLDFDKDKAVKSVFTATDQSEREKAIFNFEIAYVKKQRKLVNEVLNNIKAEGEVLTDAPTDSEYQQYESAWRAKREKELKELSLGAGAGAAMPGALAAAPAPVPVVGPNHPGALGTPARDDETRQLRLACAIERAKLLRCYAAADSLDDRTAEITKGGSRSIAEIIADMWYAQICLWVEEDILKALAGLNDKVARQQPGDARWVAYLPVKRLIRFRLGNYVARDATGGSAGATGAAVGNPFGGVATPASGSGTVGEGLLAAPSSMVFTKRGSTDSVDVLRFSLSVIVDATRLLQVLDAISAAGFYTPISVDVEDSPAEPGYIFGTAPTVRLDLVCEGCFLRAAYDTWMPAEVKTAISEGRAGGMGKGGSAAVGTTPRFPNQFAPARPTDDGLERIGGPRGGHRR